MAAGYGFRAPNDCWASAWLVVSQVTCLTVTASKWAHEQGACESELYTSAVPNVLLAHECEIVVQTIWGQLLDAVVMGVIFARISHPKQRARTVFMSDSAVVARRDGATPAACSAPAPVSELVHPCSPQPCPMCQSSHAAAIPCSAHARYSCPALP